MQEAADALPAWRRWVRIFCITFAGSGLLLYTLLLLIDPYDTGRFPSLPIVGTGDRTLRTAAASHGRDPRFNATVIGNSTGELLDPFRLRRATGLRFTQLAIAGTGPREQLTVMNWVISHHPRYGAFVIVTDTTWCTSDPNPPMMYPFPFWLYGSDLDYLANVLSPKALDRVAYRVQIALGLMQPADPVAYFDYRGAVSINFVPEPIAHDEPADPHQPLPRFPWIDRLSEILAGLPPNIRVVVAMPPVYYTELPSPGTEKALRIDTCKAALARSVATRPHSAFIDFRVDTELAHDTAEFIDPYHYGHKLARLMEDRIIAVLRAAENATTGAANASLVAAQPQPDNRAP
jgi:hypothetical protein